MPFEPELESGETLIHAVTYQPSSRVEPFAFAVSRQAIYHSAKKALSVGDPWYMRRIPIDQVQGFELRRLRPFGAVLTGALMALAGLCGLGLVLAGGEAAPRSIGLLLGVFAAGVALPIAARGRRGLHIELEKGRYRYKPVNVLGSEAKAAQAALLDEIAAALTEAGVPALGATPPGPIRPEAQLHLSAANPSFALYHPEDFAEDGWVIDDLDELQLPPLFEAGRLVLVTLPGGRETQVELHRGALPGSLRAEVVAQREYRLSGARGRAVLVSADMNAFEWEDRTEFDASAAWIELPEAHYRCVAYLLRSASGALQRFALTVEAVEDWDAVAFPEDEDVHMPHA